MELQMAAGIVGAAMLAVMQFAHQRRWLAANEPAALTINLFGAVLLLVSLLAEWNTAVGLLTVLWIGVSLAGLGASLKGGAWQRFIDPDDAPDARTTGHAAPNRRSVRL